MANELKAKVEEAQKSIDLKKKTYTADLDTDKGHIRLTFFPDLAPGHVLNFLGLAKSGYYDGLTFHRIIAGFMIQGGCNLGTGTGGPGYSIKAEFNKTPHVAGVLSMARSNDPDSGGSQFFICLDNANFLDNKYTAFGKVADEESMKTLKTIGAVKTGANDKPVDKVTIKKVTVTEAAK